MQELAKIPITQSISDDGELHFDTHVSDGTEFIRAMGMLETAKLELYDELPKADDDG